MIEKWEIKIKRCTKRISPPHYVNPPGLTKINNLTATPKTIYTL